MDTRIIAMNNIFIKETSVTPEINFDFQNNIFEIKGESYPEDVQEFYGQPLTCLESHLREQKNTKIIFNFRWVYFNSSTIRILYNLFDLLILISDTNKIEINWYYHTDDEMMEEVGGNFSKKIKSENNISFSIQSFNE